jgi:hypothetical protein
MRGAIVSDINGNRRAFQAVLADLRQERAGCLFAEVAESLIWQGFPRDCHNFPKSCGACRFHKTGGENALETLPHAGGMADGFSLLP